MNSSVKFDVVSMDSQSTVLLGKSTSGSVHRFLCFRSHRRPARIFSESPPRWGGGVPREEGSPSPGTPLPAPGAGRASPRCRTWVQGGEPIPHVLHTPLPPRSPAAAGGGRWGAGGCGGSPREASPSPKAQHPVTPQCVVLTEGSHPVTPPPDYPLPPPAGAPSPGPSEGSHSITPRGSAPSPCSCESEAGSDSPLHVNPPWSIDTPLHHTTQHVNLPWNADASPLHLLTQHVNPTWVVDAPLHQTTHVNPARSADAPPHRSTLAEYVRTLRRQNALTEDDETNV